MKRIDAILLGAGQRGAESYAPYARLHPHALRFVAVVEPDTERRRHFAEQYGIAGDRCFASAEPLFALGKLADAAFICSPDRAHYTPAMEAMRLGYHLLLEKPFATSPAECAALVAAARAAGVRMHICHVARHTKHFGTMHELVQSGVLGEIVNVNHAENVSYWHMAHSYVRGNWRREDESAPMLLAKCCHDLDLLAWSLDDPVVRLTSIGSLKHFRPENAPAGATLRCTDGCPAKDQCPYYAPRIYGAMTPLFTSAAHGGNLPVRWGFGLSGAMIHLLYDASERVPALRKVAGYDGWPRSVLDADPTPANIDRALREGPYGRCVYHCDNDVVDHQVVSMELRSGASVTLTMHGHSAIEERTTYIHGSRGSLSARIGVATSSIDVITHVDGKTHHHDTTGPRLDGHGGGDLALVDAFVKALQAGDHTDHGEAALESHLLAFAAEEARREQRWVEMDSYRARFTHRTRATSTAEATTPNVD